MDPRPFLREHVAGRPMIVGGVFALALGLGAGSYLTAGELFPERPAPQLVVRGEEQPQPIYYMTDASGRIPEYVIGADNAAPRDNALFPEPIAWEEPIEPEPTAAVAPVALQAPQLAYAPPPSTDGDILRIHHDGATPLALDTPADLSPPG